MIPFITSRTSTWRLLPPRLAGGIKVRHAPIHRRSGHSDIAICCGRNVLGSSPSTSVVPLSNQVTTLNHKRFKGFKMFSDGHLGQVAKEAVLINLPHKGANSSVSVKDILDTGVDFGPDVIPVINTGWTEKTWGKPEFWEQMPYLEPGVGELMAKKNVPAVAMDVFRAKAIWRGVKLDAGAVWVANHLALLEKGIPVIQFVTNLSQIGKNRFVMIAAPLKIKGGDASPARVLALVE